MSISYRFKKNADSKIEPKTQGIITIDIIFYLNNKYM